MPKRYGFVLLLAALPVAAMAAEILHVSGTGAQRDIACATGQDVSISGRGHRLALTGPCGEVEIRGSGHVVSFDTARSLIVSGIDNEARGGKAGRLSVDTTRNTVSASIGVDVGASDIAVAGADQTVDITLTGPAALAVHGTRNRILWQAATGVPAPTVEISGVDNRAARR
ncbi:DUF3060 domain-containing protein [Bosea sp. (in: a-proteobacteria)]|uniref:DUF3060 domain-containing protein n=1 Tax=Bosea sp. (in: a-proteobacteria) TaxID=1871050 RepID=UPI003B3B1F57